MSKEHDRLVELAKCYVGVREDGPNHGELVEEFQKAVDGKAQGESWCACFVQYCVARVDEELGTQTSLAKSEHCLTIWGQSGNRIIEGEVAFPGCIAIWQHGNSLNGHTGIVTEIIDAETFRTVEGNTGPGAGVIREGDGVYERVRTRATQGGTVGMHLIGFIDPWG